MNLRYKNICYTYTSILRSEQKLSTNSNRMYYIDCTYAEFIADVDKEYQRYNSSLV